MLTATKTNRARRQAGAARLTALLLPAALLTGWGQAAQAQVPADPYNYSRASAFEYYLPADGALNGLLKTETIEPGNPNLCVVTTYGYDAYGNKNSATTANCTGNGGRSAFTQRTSASSYTTQTVNISVSGTSTSVVIPDGAVPSTVTNALLQAETKTFDPRFGAVLSLTGPNSLTTTWTLDDFGRKVRETRADGTSTITAYCYLSGKVADLSSNSSQCASLSFTEAPSDAVSVVHTEPHNTSDAKSGPYARVYMDRAGHKIRSVTEAFDGATQPGGTARLIVQDTDYNPYGAQVVSTQPYFLDTGASTATGTTHYGMTLTVYDVLGRPTQAYATDVANLPTATSGNAGGSQTSVAFGNRGSYQASLTSIAYVGLKTTTTNDKGQTRIEEKNVDGKLVRVTDALGAQVAHQHDAFGNLVTTKDALQNSVSLSYDTRGRKLSMTDPDSGLWQYDYDALGQLVWQQSANQRALATATTMAYDLLGRMTQRVDPEYTSTWSYDKYADSSACAKGTGKLCESNTSHGINRKLAYDGYGRPLNTRTTVSNGPSFASAVSYDAATGRLLTQTYPTGLQLSYSYTAKGFLSSLNTATAVTINPLPATPGGAPVASKTLNAGAALWTAQAYNAWGKAEQTQLSSSVYLRSSFDPSTGRVLRDTAGLTTATNVEDYSYVWDSLGHLSQRTDANGDGNTGSVTDTYGYDSLGRLANYTVSAPALPNLTRSVTLQYNALGTLLYKSDVGNYSYPGQGPSAVRPHALQSVAGAVSTSFGYDANGNLTSASAGLYRSISYTSFNLPDSQNGLKGPNSSPQYTWQYDENHQRIKETRWVNGGPNVGTRVTWMLHPDNQGGLGFESETAPNGSSVSNRHYLSVGGASIGVLVTTGALPTLSAGQMAPTVLGSMTAVKLEYWHKDHLGSLVATSDHLGNITARYAYDPFGKRRQTTGQYDSFGTLVVDWTSNTNAGTDRGYTGHEHLDDIGVIHMNGRIFDPTLARFLQADPFIQDPYNLQNFDRYTYCYNNPLTCTDPSGHLSFFGHKILPGLFNNRNLRIGASIVAAM
jgi:RHS repeat-associated protein